MRNHKHEKIVEAYFAELDSLLEAAAILDKNMVKKTKCMFDAA